MVSSSVYRKQYHYLGSSGRSHRSTEPPGWWGRMRSAGSARLTRSRGRWTGARSSASRPRCPCKLGGSSGESRARTHHPGQPGAAQPRENTRICASGFCWFGNSLDYSHSATTKKPFNPSLKRPPQSERGLWGGGKYVLFLDVFIVHGLLWIAHQKYIRNY